MSIILLLQYFLFSINSIYVQPDYGPQQDHNVLFLCSKNSCRSQIADAYLRMLRKDRSIGVAYAGINGASAVKPAAAEVMTEVGVNNLIEYSSNSIEEFDSEHFDIVVSCCNKCENLDLKWKKSTYLDWNIRNPTNKEECTDLSEQRIIRNQIFDKVKSLLVLLEDN